MSEPKYTHDCTHCIFLGTYEWDKFEPNKVYDLYIHLNKDSFHSFIAREGSDGPDYISGPYGWKSPTDYPTRIAYDRAVALKLIEPETKDVQTLNYDEKIAQQKHYEQRLKGK